MKFVVDIDISLTPRNSKLWLSASMNLMHSSVAYISAPAELLAVTVGHFDSQ